VVVGLISQIALACDVGYSTRASYRDFMDRVTPAVEYVKDLDDSFYRMDKTFHRQPADAMALELRGLSSTTSTLNRHTLKLLDQLGFAAGSYWSEYLGATPVTDMLLGVKYVVSDNTLYDGLYEKIYSDKKGDNLYVYQNPYALSLGFTANKAILDLDFDDYDSPMTLLNDLCAAMTGKESNRPFLPLESRAPIAEKLSISYTSKGDHTIYKKTSEDPESGSITLSFTTEQDGLSYMFLPTEYPRECKIYVDGREFGTVMGNDSDCIFPLGRLKAGEEHTVKLVPLEEKTYFKDCDVCFWTLDTAILESCYDALKDGQFLIDSDYKEDHLTGSVTAREEDTLLFTSIPYDKGWIITVDGKEVKPYTSTKILYDEKTGLEIGSEEQPYQDALIVLSLSRGSHEISFKYRPDCFTYGLAVTVTSLALLSLIVLADYGLWRPYKRRKAAKRAELLQEPPAVENDFEKAQQSEE
jgi:uncharacterized membrane protein YfhO